MKQRARKLLKPGLLALLSIVCIMGTLLTFNEVTIRDHKIMIHNKVVVQWKGVVANSQPASSSASGSQPGVATDSNTQLSITLPPGSQLPGENACNASARRSTFEARSDNAVANQSVPTSTQIMNLDPWTSDVGMNARSDSIRTQITGNFTGTTDEILQWVACKWGVDVNIIRAQAVAESTWHQNFVGDYTTDPALCPPGTWNGSSCYQSYGLLQVKYIDWKHSWPMSKADTAFNVEFAYGWMRNCYEGWADYLYQQSANYHAGDIWGCVGFWYSGGWYDSGAVNYINTVKGFYQQKPWLQAGF